LKDKHKVPEISLGSYACVALLTSLVASIAGSLLVVMLGVLISPGDGGVEAAMMVVVPFTIAGAVIAFPIGAVALLVIGVPLARASASSIQRRPLLASLTGFVVGGFLGAFAAAILGLLGPTFSLAALMSGAVFGLLWILAVRFILLVPKRSSDG
jgi:hypothetical protein